LAVVFYELWQIRIFSAKTRLNRQTIYAMETGTYLPNTTIALKLARVPDVKLEDL
jgi:DNA-binding XRE family transcriptional regulator